MCAQACFDADLILESDKSKAAGSPSIFVHHEGGVNNTSKLSEVILELILCSILAHAPDKYFGRLLLLISGNGPFWIDLNILVNHHNFDGLAS